MRLTSILVACLAALITAPAALAVPRLDHVVVLMLENKSPESVWGGKAPYLDALARRGAVLTDYHGVSHPSLPNYLALVSGTTAGITSDCTTCHVRVRSIADTLDSGWRAYVEDLPANGADSASSGLYAQRHVPFLYFEDVLRTTAQRRRVVPLTQLKRDLSRGRLPRFALIVPNLCHDMHDCSVTVGDRWLATFMPALLRSAALRNGVVFIVFDEGEDAQNRVPALAVGPAVRPGSRFASPINHYGLLRTVEQALGLPLLGRSGTARAISGIWR